MNITERQVINIWENKVFSDKESMHMYIHSPFCVGLCKYCIYQSADMKDISREIYDTHFNGIIKQIKSFSEVLGKMKIKSIYFGGGTPSIMPFEILEKIANIIPNWADISVKVFEANPISTNKNKIDKLVELGFTYLSFGVQTLDKDELVKQKRKCPKDGHLKELTKYAEDKGLHINYDIMSLINPNIEEDSKRLFKDLNIIMREYKPHSIDVYPDVRLFNNISRERIIELLIPLRKSLYKAIFLNNDFHVMRGIEELDINDLKKLLNNGPNNYHLLRISDEEFKKRKVYSCSSPDIAPSTQNVISFGGYNDLWTYSYTADVKDVYYCQLDNRGMPQYSKTRR